MLGLQCGQALIQSATKVQVYSIFVTFSDRPPRITLERDVEH
jgi:hypothetical protein